jgi:BirA family transcriptional regulator, biotin operon repressor / biotin---[acetyl-CoA-carboxylase] ligase
MAEGSGEASPFGTPRLHLRRCDSTNERARALALAGAPHGALVTADEQTAGRGRQGRSWVAPAGTSLLCSSLLLFSELAHPPSLLPLTAGVALCEAIGEGTRLKWPNDVVLGEARAKVAGILVEGRPQAGWAIVGIGVNVAVPLERLPAQLRGRAATLGRTADAIEPLLADLLAALASWLQEPAQGVLARWRSLDALRGRQVAWAQGSGVAQGIDDDGRLLVRLANGGETALDAGEVHLASA